MIDCSHGNSRKDYRNQSTVCRDVLGQIVDERKAKRENNEENNKKNKIIGLMIESNLKEGKQFIQFDENKKLKPLEKGISVVTRILAFLLKKQQYFQSCLKV